MYAGRGGGCGRETKGKEKKTGDKIRRRKIDVRNQPLGKDEDGRLNFVFPSKKKECRWCGFVDGARREILERGFRKGDTRRTNNVTQERTWQGAAQSHVKG
jgi:hypothetical protein